MSNFHDYDRLVAALPERGSDDERHRAARYVATRAVDTADAVMLLDALGLSAEEGKLRMDAESVEKAAPVPDTGDGATGRARSTYEARNPHSCARCGKRWSSLRVAHCGACHRSFATVGLFDLHRSPQGQHGTCVPPVEVVRNEKRLLFFRDGMWRGPAMSDEEKQRLYGRPS